MQLPNFLIVGAQKCGTTMLHNTLSKHPQIFMSDVKEINYFTIESNYSKGLKEYSKNFELSKEKHEAIGESSPGYMCYPGVAEKILKNLGKVKIIMLIRDPIKRSLSQYWDNRRHFNEKLTFSETLNKYLEFEYDPNSKGYFSRGVYDIYINNYIRLFGLDNIHISVFEEFISNPKEELNKITHFLSVNDFDPSIQLSEKKNSAFIYENPLYKYFLENPSIASKIPARMRRLFFFGKKTQFKYSIPNQYVVSELREFYKPSIENLENILGKELNSWKLVKGTYKLKL